MIKSLFKFPATLLKNYNHHLMNSPFKTKMTTAGITYFLADCICQNKVENKTQSDTNNTNNNNEYSLIRSLRQASVGAFFAAPSLHVWHSNILPKIVKACTKTVTRVGVSVLLNETMLASYFIGCLLFSFETLKTMSVNSGVQNVQNKFSPALGASMKFWTGLSLINYSLIPVHLRPVFVSCWSMVWQTYLSYVSNNTNVNQTIPVCESECGFL